MSIVDSATVVLGCDPYIEATIQETADGSLIIFLAAPEGEDLSDIDGIFFDLSETSTATELSIFPEENAGEITGFELTDDAADSLSNGAQLNVSYDVGVQFGTTPDSTEGTVSEVAFTLYSDQPLSLEDIDLESLAVVVDSDTPDGMVLLPTSGGTEDVVDDDADSCSFLIEGDVTVKVVLTQLDTGEIEMSLDVLEGELTADLRAVYFDIGNESLLDGMTASGADVTDSAFKADSVDNLGNGTNIKGETDGAFDGGVEIGTQGAGKDDIQSTTITLSHPEGLSLSDFSAQDFAIRLTSVGETGTDDREDSLKLDGQCPGVEPKPCEDQYMLYGEEEDDHQVDEFVRNHEDDMVDMDF